VHPRKQEAIVERIAPAIPIPEDAQRLLFRTRVAAVVAFALAMMAASWIEHREPVPAAPPSTLAGVP
jgi:hypothetical protein